MYEEIAGHFSDTRHSPWPRVVEFLKQLPLGALVADVGCGNGKYLSINPSIHMVRILEWILSNKQCYLYNKPHPPL